MPRPVWQRSNLRPDRCDMNYSWKKNPALGRTKKAHWVDKKPVNTTGYNPLYTALSERKICKEILIENSKITQQLDVQVRCPAL